MERVTAALDSLTDFVDEKGGEIIRSYFWLLIICCGIGTFVGVVQWLT